MSGSIRIFIADDHELVRDGIKSRLTLSGEMVICGEAENGARAVKLCKEISPDIIFLDISMPEMSGLDAAKEILENDPDARIVFLSIYDNPEYVREALRIGAKGYLLKDVSREEMTLAVKAIHNGGTYLGSKVSQSVVSGEQKQPAACKYNLSERERQVLIEIANGSKNKTIAEKLNLSVRTVESHRLTLREKTGGGNAAELFRIANELGLI
ncbi:MAG: response regulator transcription factor [Rhizobiaceae bacterium]|nr:response regulator transcription factor [Rhizobiaceae bacterium]